MATIRQRAGKWEVLKGHCSGDLGTSATWFRTLPKSEHPKVSRNKSRLNMQGCQFHQNATQDEAFKSGGVSGPELGPTSFRFLGPEPVSKEVAVLHYVAVTRISCGRGREDAEKPARHLAIIFRRETASEAPRRC
jgi:hypothetical protein